MKLTESLNSASEAAIVGSRILLLRDWTSRLKGKRHFRERHVSRELEKNAGILTAYSCQQQEKRGN